MKKISLIIGLFICFQSNGQILKKLADKAKDKLEKKVNKNGNDPTNGGSGESNTNTIQDTTTTPGANNVYPASLKIYSKYDFVPGEKIIWLEDFSPDAIGDFPAKWNTNGSAEIVSINGKEGKWMMLTTKGFFMPDGVDSLPEDFTLEFDMLVDQEVHSWGIYTVLAELTDRDKPENWRSSVNSFSLNILPGVAGNGQCSYDRRKAGTGEAATTSPLTSFSDISKPVHVAFWRQKERLRVYLNETKTWDIPKAFVTEAKLNSLIFFIQLTDGKWHFLLNNLRLAVGAPDTRKKILEQNKWVTHGILFDVNSATIKPESYGSLKEMANVLKEYTDLKVKIVGHTDADGSDAANLDLSKRRAAAVKTALSNEFGIQDTRMETDGKGESEPIDKNDSPAGKANNRRVEFIKL